MSDVTIDEAGAAMHNDRGIEYIEKGDFKNAVEEYNKAIECDSTYAVAYVNRASAFAQVGNYGKAIEDYTKAITLDCSAKRLNARGQTYLSMGRRGEAIADLERAILLYPEYALSYYHLANVSSGEKAIDNYRKAICLGMRNDADAHFNLGCLYSARGAAKKTNGDRIDAIVDFDDAIREYTEAIRCDRNYVPAYYNRGLACLDSGLVEAAVNDLKYVLGCDSNHANAHYHLGNAYLVDNTDEAIREYEKASELATQKGDLTLAQKAQDALTVAKLIVFHRLNGEIG